MSTAARGWASRWRPRRMRKKCWRNSKRRRRLEMSTKNLLVELFVEELPPKALKKLGESFSQTLAQSLKAQGLSTDTSVVTPYASPRRLAAHVTAVGAQAADRKVSQKLMPVAVGLDASG